MEAADIVGVGRRSLRFCLETGRIERENEAAMAQLGKDARVVFQYVVDQDGHFTYRAARRYFAKWSDDRFYASVGRLFVNDLIENDR